MCNLILIINIFCVIVLANSQYLIVPQNNIKQINNSETAVSYNSNPKYFPSAQSNLPFCCERAYNAKHFFLLSPGFPSINNGGNDCVYHIYRANPNICRLRIFFRYFWLEDNTQNYCLNNFLEIDGKPICGCQIGLQLVSSFDINWGNRPKVIRLKNKPFNKNSVSGFTLEVIQDECLKRIIPEGRALSKREIVRNNNENPSIVRHYYFFDGSGENNFNPQFVPKTIRDTEETLYIDTSATNFVVPKNSNYQVCQTWGKIQWELLANEIPPQQINKCSSPENSFFGGCRSVAANFDAGYIQSPGYPYASTQTVNLCYRIFRRQNSCAVRVTFEDFQVTNSLNCQGDYLMISGRSRYCGQSLHRATLTFDMKNKRYEELIYRTRGNSCGRGFRAVYEHIPCYNTINPPRPVYPIIKPTPICPQPLLPTTIPPSRTCNRIISDKSFVVEVFQEYRCVINILKSSTDVCQLSLTFDVSNLACGSEYLIIDNKKYCGQLKGQTVNVNFSSYQLSLIYERSSVNPIITGLRFRLAGAQMTDGCDPYEFPKVEPERLLLSQNKSKSIILLRDQNVSIVEPERLLFSQNKPKSIVFPRVQNVPKLEPEKLPFSQNKPKIIVFPQNQNEVCGVVINDTISSLSECMSDGAKSCVRVQANVTYIPVDTATRDKLILDNRVLYEVLCKDAEKFFHRKR